MTEHKKKGGSETWQITKEKIIMVVGIGVIVYEMIIGPLLGQDFHYEWLILGAACMGISVAQWGDKK